jgi:hypothetical protein
MGRQPRTRVEPQSQLARRPSSAQFRARSRESLRSSRSTRVEHCEGRSHRDKANEAPCSAAWLRSPRRVQEPTRARLLLDQTARRIRRRVQWWSARWTRVPELCPGVSEKCGVLSQRLRRGPNAGAVRRLPEASRFRAPQAGQLEPRWGAGHAVIQRLSRVLARGALSRRMSFGLRFP